MHGGLRCISAARSFISATERWNVDVDPLIIGHQVAALSNYEKHVSHLLSRVPTVDRRFANSSRKLKLLYQNDRPAADFSGNARES